MKKPKHFIGVKEEREAQFCDVTLDKTVNTSASPLENVTRELKLLWGECFLCKV